MSYEAILGELGENLIAASSAREAFQYLVKTEIAVILMDVQMPELDGFELAAIVRDHPRFERTAIIFVSAIHLSDLDQLRGYAAGAVDYVSVPIVPEVLRAKVRVFADLYRKTRQLERMNEELERRVAERTAELEASSLRLVESERRRSIALAAGSMGSWDWNSDTGDVGWDEGQYRICGLTPGVFRPTTESVWAVLHPDDREAVQSAMFASLTLGETFHREFRILRPNGEERWCVSTGITSQGVDGQSPLLSGVTYDITERKLAEQALAQTNEMLERRIEERTRERELAISQLFEAQKIDTIGQLTGGVAHDFNNLLMAILGSLDMLRKRLHDEKELRLLNNAIEGAQRGAALTKRLLAFARRQELKPVAVDVAELVNNIAELLQRALGPSVQLTISIPFDLPPIEIDPNQFELALLNLAVNARDAMPDGGSLSISAALVRGGEYGPLPLQQGDYLCVSLVDSGVGMDEMTLAKATEPFFTTKGPGKGTGLGLSMVYGMAAQSGGALHLASAEGNGTTVDLFLPLASSREAVPIPQPEPVPPTDAPAPAKLNVLVVDDDFLVRIGTTAMLEDLGHSVIEAQSASEALQVLEKSDTVDLVLTDFAMPGMNGAELIGVISNRFARVNVILVSGYNEASKAEIKSRCIRLSKPFSQDQLAAAICQAVNESAHETAAE
ncbi:MAG: response regulator [Pseudomonadota bacterium]